MYNSTHVYKNSFIKWELFQKWPYINKNYLPKKQAIKKFCLISFYRKQLEKLNKIHRKMIEFWKDKPRQLSSPKFWRQGKQTKVRSHLLLLLMPWDFLSFFLSYFSFIFISWRLITLQYCSGFCHTLTWISHGFTCIPHLHSMINLNQIYIVMNFPDFIFVLLHFILDNSVYFQILKLLTE